MYNTTGERAMYDTIKLPHALVLQVEETVKQGFLGYRNRSEFIIEAVRDKIREIARMQEVK